MDLTEQQQQQRQRNKKRTHLLWRRPVRDRIVETKNIQNN